MNINEFLQKTRRTRQTGTYTFQLPRLHVVCNDGFKMSVQAGQYLYSTPRTDDAPTYSAVEVGYPSEYEELLMPYVEDANDPTGTVYGYVPVEVVDAIIEKHGGINVEAYKENTP